MGEYKYSEVLFQQSWQVYGLLNPQKNEGFFSTSKSHFRSSSAADVTRHYLEYGPRSRMAPIEIVFNDVEFFRNANKR